MRIIKENIIESKGKILCIDFDGTVVENDYPEIKKLRDGAKYYINKLYDEGYKIIIWTCRTNNNVEKDDLIQVKIFLDNEGIKYHKINENIDGLEFNPWPKVYCDINIDDKNLGGIPDWKTIYDYIKNKKEVNWNF